MANDKGIKKELLPAMVVDMKDVYVNEKWNARSTEEYEGTVPKRGKGESGVESDEAIKSLGEDIRARGQMNPCFVVALDELPLADRKNAQKGAKWFLVAGFRRARAIGLAGIPTVLIRVAAGHSLTDILLLNLTENTSRKDLSMYDLGKRCKEVIDAGELSLNATADVLARGGGKRYSKGHVGSLVRFHRVLIPEILTAWKMDEPWCSFVRLNIAAKKHTTREDKSIFTSDDDKEAQRQLWIEWSGRGKTAGDGDDNVDADKGTAGQEDESTKTHKPSAANIEAAIVECRKKEKMAEMGSVEEIAYRAAVSALQWTQGFTRQGVKINMQKPLKVLNKIDWSTGASKAKAEADKDEADEE